MASFQGFCHAAALLFFRKNRLPVSGCVESPHLGRRRTVRPAALALARLANTRLSREILQTGNDRVMSVLWQSHDRPPAAKACAVMPSRDPARSHLGLSLETSTNKLFLLTGPCQIAIEIIADYASYCRAQRPLACFNQAVHPDSQTKRQHSSWPW